MKWYWWVGIIIAVAVAARLLFAWAFPNYRTSGDSVTYYHTARRIVLGHQLTDPWRTPGYPILMAVPYILEGKAIPPTISQTDFTPEFWDIRVAQAVAGVVSLLLLFFLLRQLGISDNLAGVFTTFMGCNWMFLVFEYYLIPETFATLWLVGTVFLAVILLKRFQIIPFILLILSSIFGTLLRPLNIALPAVLLFVLVWHHRSRTVFLASLLAIVVYGEVFMWYSQTNYVTSSYRGISRISDFNMLGKILAYRLPVDRVSNTGGMRDMIGSYMSYMGSPDPWEAFRQMPDLYANQSAMPFHDFVWNVIGNNLWSFTNHTISEIPSALTNTPLADEKMIAPGVVGQVFMAVSTLYQYIQIVDLMVFIAVPVCFILSWQRRTVRRDGLFLLSLVGIYHIVVACFLSYSDYSRLMSPAQPLMLFISLGCLYVVVKRLWDAAYKRIDLRRRNE